MGGSEPCDNCACNPVPFSPVPIKTEPVSHMFGKWLKLSTDIAIVNFDAQQVIALRLSKIAKGGPAAHREARRMVVERVAASAEAGLAIAAGRPVGSIVRRYGTIVRANKRRLTASL
jgi:hypothetical protein